MKDLLAENFTLAIKATQREPIPRFIIFSRFTQLCDYINQHNMTRNEYKVFLSNLTEINENEYRLIPNLKVSDN